MWLYPLIMGGIAADREMWKIHGDYVKQILFTKYEGGK